MVRPVVFVPKTWADGRGGGTPIQAVDLNRIEQGIVDAHDPAAIGALPGIVIDSDGTPDTTVRARIVLDEFGDIDDILTEET